MIIDLWGKRKWDRATHWIRIVPNVLHVTPEGKVGFHFEDGTLIDVKIEHIRVTSDDGNVVFYEDRISKPVHITKVDTLSLNFEWFWGESYSHPAKITDTRRV